MEFLLSLLCAAVAAFAAAEGTIAARKRRRVLRVNAEAPAPHRSWISVLASAVGERAESSLARGAGPTLIAAAGRRLAAAGVEGRSFAAGYVVLRAAGAVAVGCVAADLLAAHRLAAFFAAFTAAWLLIDLSLFRRARARRETIERELPFALDLLTLCVEAGLDFSAALSRVAERLRSGALAAELKRTDASLRMGLPRREALAQLAGRTASPSLSSLCALLIQADRLGAGVGGVLRTTSSRLRAMRFARAERRGAVAAQQALVPLIFCIMPATMGIVFGPIVIRVFYGGVAALF